MSAKTSVPGSAVPSAFLVPDPVLALGIGFLRVARDSLDMAFSIG
jgi:hypothetical protein